MPKILRIEPSSCKDDINTNYNRYHDVIGHVYTMSECAREFSHETYFAQSLTPPPHLLDDEKNVT